MDDSGLLQNLPSGILDKDRRVFGPKVTVTVREREGKSKNLCRSRGRCFFGGVVFLPCANKAVFPLAIELYYYSDGSARPRPLV